MITCPYCKQQIDDDSRYCDQCGQHLSYCPDCGTPKKGSICPACGENTVPAEQFFAGAAAKQTAAPEVAAPPKAAPEVAAPPKAVEAPETTAAQPRIQQDAPLKLVGEGLTITIKEGPFGRRSGVYPEFSTCQYVSGRHGEFRKGPGGWEIMDYGSTNGTFVNGKQLGSNQPCGFSKGDKITIATLQFQVI